MSFPKLMPHNALLKIATIQIDISSDLPQKQKTRLWSLTSSLSTMIKLWDQMSPHKKIKHYPCVP